MEIKAGKYYGLRNEQDVIKIISVDPDAPSDKQVTAMYEHELTTWSLEGEFLSGMESGMDIVCELIKPRGRRPYVPLCPSPVSLRSPVPRG